MVDEGLFVVGPLQLGLRGRRPLGDAEHRVQVGGREERLDRGLQAPLARHFGWQAITK